MKVEQVFSPIKIVVESPMESGILVWALETALQTKRAEQDQNVKNILQYVRDNLPV